MKIKHFRYNAFLIEDQDIKIAIDPGKDLWVFNMRSLIPEEEWDSVTHVLVTHGDPDHFDHAVELAKQANATVVCGEALMDDFVSEGVDDVHEVHAGATVKLEGLRVEGLPTEHGPLPVRLMAGLIDVRNEVAEGTEGGEQIYVGPFKVMDTVSDMQVYSRGYIKLLFGLIRLQKENVDFARGSVGFKITIGDKSVVNLGDTVLQEGWEGLRPDVLMIPIGGDKMENTMDEPEALEAIKLIQPRHVVPCHYACDFLWRRNVNPADTETFKTEVEKMGIECTIMKYGDAIEI